MTFTSSTPGGVTWASSWRSTAASCELIRGRVDWQVDVLLRAPAGLTDACHTTRHVLNVRFLHSTSWRNVLPLGHNIMKQVHRSFLLSGRNVRWPRRMQLPDESRWAYWRDRQTDGRQTVTLRFSLHAASVLTHCHYIWLPKRGLGKPANNYDRGNLPADPAAVECYGKHHIYRVGQKKWYLAYIYYIVWEVSLFLAHPV